jgi:hypothetical protein
MGLSDKAKEKDIMSNRKRRHNQFSKSISLSGWQPRLSATLLHNAYSLLGLSLSDRQRPVQRLADDHYSEHAVGTMVVLVDALEGYLNEAISQLAFTIAPRKEISRQAVLNAADRPIQEKYEKVTELLAERPVAASTDLKLLLDVRHEIAHFLPRILEEDPPKYLPEWLQSLDDRCLLLAFPDDPYIARLLSDLLCSYKLAYWAWQTTLDAVSAFQAAVVEPTESLLIPVNGFALFMNLAAPERLHAYDLKHGLTL